jgi:hypothetical protein
MSEEKEEDGLLRLGPDGCIEPCQHQFAGDLCKFCLCPVIPEAKDRSDQALLERDQLRAKMLPKEATAFVHNKYTRGIGKTPFCAGYREDTKSRENEPI